MTRWHSCPLQSTSISKLTKHTFVYTAFLKSTIHPLTATSSSKVSMLSWHSWAFGNPVPHSLPHCHCGFRVGPTSLSWCPSADQAYHNQGAVGSKLPPRCFPSLTALLGGRRLPVPLHPGRSSIQAKTAPQLMLHLTAHNHALPSCHVPPVHHFQNMIFPSPLALVSKCWYQHRTTAKLCNDNQKKW